MCISHIAPLSVFLAIFQVIDCLCLFLHIFHFCRHTPGPTVCIPHFPHFLVFCAIFQMLQCLFLIFHVFFQFSCHNQALQHLFLIFHFFECFSPYFTSYSVCFLFCTFFSVSYHILCFSYYILYNIYSIFLI